MNIRTMSADDYNDVFSLWQSCKGMGFNNIDDSKDGIEKFLRRNPNTCFVAEIDNKIVGTILSGNDGRRGYIYHTAVIDNMQGKGIGTALVNTALEALKYEGISKVALLVFSRNENGNAFWEHLGFTARNDIIYRNKALVELIRNDT